MPISPSPSYSGVVTTNSWGPYANAKDFKGNVLMILSIILCTVLLFLAFNSIIRFLFCANCTLSTSNSNSNSNSNDEHEHEELEDPADKPMDNMRACTAAPETMMVFSKQMGAAAAECAICLSEFVEGDEIRVLAACNHVFHVRCVDKWLSLSCSCPTCRSSTVICASTSTSTSTSTSVSTTYGNGSVENV